MRDDVAVFGEIESPETNMIRVGLGESFQCPCGCVMCHDGLWLAAHWKVKLSRVCEKCGQVFHIRGPKIRLAGAPYGPEPAGEW